MLQKTTNRVDRIGIVGEECAVAEPPVTVPVPPPVPTTPVPPPSPSGIVGGSEDGNWGTEWNVYTPLEGHHDRLTRVSCSRLNLADTSETYSGQYYRTEHWEVLNSYQHVIDRYRRTWLSYTCTPETFPNG